MSISFTQHVPTETDKINVFANKTDYFRLLYSMLAQPALIFCDILFWKTVTCARILSALRLHKETKSTLSTWKSEVPGITSKKGSIISNFLPPEVFNLRFCLIWETFGKEKEKRNRGSPQTLDQVVKDLPQLRLIRSCLHQPEPPILNLATRNRRQRQMLTVCLGLKY